MAPSDDRVGHDRVLAGKGLRAKATVHPLLLVQLGVLPRRAARRVRREGPTAAT